MFVLLVIFVVPLLYYYLTRNFNYWESKNVKGPTPIPLFGNMKSVALRKQHMGMFYHEIYKQYPEEKVVGLYRMATPTLLIRDLDIAKQVLIKDFEAFPDRGVDFSQEGLGDNIFHSDVNTWKYLRPRFTSVFTSSKLMCLFSILVDKGEKLTEHMESVTIKEPEQDVYEVTLKYAVATVMAAVFGLDIDTFTDNRLFEIVDHSMNTTYSNEMDLIYPGFMVKFNLSLVSEKANKLSHQIVEAGFKLGATTMSDLLNVMDILRSMKKEADISENKANVKITEDLLAAQAWIFFIAGYGNNSLATTYALYHLARNIDVQEKLSKEIDEVLVRHHGKMTYEAFKEMKYLGMVFKETLRMHPITNGLVRSACRDVKIEGTHLTIEKGSTVVVSPYAIQHDEKHYPDPERFNPERFLPENPKRRHPCAFLSFGAGRRSCLGSQLGKMQFGIALIKVLSKFRVETTANTISSIQYDPWRLLLTPQHRIRLKFLPK